MKWKCEKCKKHGLWGGECNADIPNCKSPPEGCLFPDDDEEPDWHKIETEEEWLDLEDEPDRQCYNCIYQYITTICSRCYKDDGYPYFKYRGMTEMKEKSECENDWRDDYPSWVCPQCGNTMVKANDVGVYYKDKEVGIYDILYCQNCKEELYPNEAWEAMKKIDEEIQNTIDKMVEDLDTQEFREFCCHHHEWVNSDNMFHTTQEYRRICKRCGKTEFVGGEAFDEKEYARVHKMFHEPEKVDYEELDREYEEYLIDRGMPDTKAKPDTKPTEEEWEAYEKAIKSNPLKERIEMLEEIAKIHGVGFKSHRERIEKLEREHVIDVGTIKRLLNDVEELKKKAHDHHNIVVEVNRMHDEIEELQKKAHEHPTTFEDKSWTSTTGQCLHEWSKKSAIIRCVKCGMPKVEAMYPSPRWE